MALEVNTLNLIQGPAQLYVAPFGTAEPADAKTAPGALWKNLGGTKDGCELTIGSEYSVLDVDQVFYDVDRRLTKRTLAMKTNLAEATLENLAIALNNTAPAAGKLSGDDGMKAFVPKHVAVMLIGFAPGGKQRVVIFRRALSTDSVTSSYKKDDQTLIPVTFSGHWVSPTVAPFVIMDEPLVP